MSDFSNPRSRHYYEVKRQFGVFIIPNILARLISVAVNKVVFLSLLASTIATPAGANVDPESIRGDLSDLINNSARRGDTERFDTEIDSIKYDFFCLAQGEGPDKLKPENAYITTFDNIEDLRFGPVQVLMHDPLILSDNFTKEIIANEELIEVTGVCITSMGHAFPLFELPRQEP